MTKLALAGALAAMPHGLLSVRAEVDPSEALAKAFEAFKTEHTKQLDDLKAGMADVVQAEKVDRINKEIGKLQATIEDQAKKIAAAQLNAGSERKIANPEYTGDFLSYMKKGQISAALDKGADADGGYLAPTEWDRTITDKLVLVSPMRSICRVQSISVGSFKKAFNLRGMASGWVGETAARPETNTPTFGELTYTPGELYANPAATQQMLDDAQIDLESFIAADVATEFARAEGAAFVSGDGANKPNGILTYVTGGANAAAHPFGAILVRTATGTAGALDNADDIVSLVHDLPSQVSMDAQFAMNKNTLAKVRLLKDAQDRYLWQPSYQAGQPQTLLGYPVTEVPDMPDIATGAIPILFGDFADSYLIVDRVGTRVLRDPFTNKPYVMFYTTKRVGGGLLNPEEMKAFKIN
ncbi:MAG: phage major capsid protein [Porphyrobacter sp.]|nr:phage major capsid protein [Porphyrobacter sp.]